MMFFYDRLYHSENFNDLGIDEFLPSLVAQIVGAFSAGRDVESRVEVGDFILDSKTLSTLGIIVNELITNSMKYAFSGVSRGLITVTASKYGPTVTIAYEDNGPGVPESAGFWESSGFGMQLRHQQHEGAQALGGERRILERRAVQRHVPIGDEARASCDMEPVETLASGDSASRDPAGLALPTWLPAWPR